MCLGTYVSGHNRVWAQSCLGTNHMCLGTNVFENKCVWAQTCLSTNVSAQTCLGTIVSGHKRNWTEICLGTIVRELQGIADGIILICIAELNNVFYDV